MQFESFKLSAKLLYDNANKTNKQTKSYPFFPGLYFHVVGEGVVNLSKKAESVTDRESYIDFRLRLLGEQGEKESDHTVLIQRLECVKNAA